jgi:hypothetical protein
MASNSPGFYRFEVGYPSPTSSQNLGSKRVQYLPIMAKIHFTGLKAIKNPNYIVKNPLWFNYRDYPLIPYTRTLK